MARGSRRRCALRLRLVPPPASQRECHGARQPVLRTHHRPWLAGGARTLTAVGAAILVGTAGCGDGGSGPSRIDGTYELISIDGQRLPIADVFEDGTPFSITDGDLTLDDGDYTLAIEVTAGGQRQRVFDDGTYKRNGDTVDFTSELGDSFEGRLSNGNRTLTLDDGTSTVVFQR